MKVSDVKVATVVQYLLNGGAGTHNEVAAALGCSRATARRARAIADRSLSTPPAQALSTPPEHPLLSAEHPPGIVVEGIDGPQPVGVSRGCSGPEQGGCSRSDPGHSEKDKDLPEEENTQLNGNPIDLGFGSNASGSGPIELGSDQLGSLELGFPGIGNAGAREAAAPDPKVEVTEETIWAGEWQDKTVRAKAKANAAVFRVLRDVWLRDVWLGWAGQGPPETGLDLDRQAIGAVLAAGATPRGILEAWAGVPHHPWLQKTLAEGQPVASLRALLRGNGGKLYEDLRAAGARARAASQVDAVAVAQRFWINFYEQQGFAIYGGSPREDPTAADHARWDRPGVITVAKVTVTPGFGRSPVFELGVSQTGWRSRGRFRVSGALAVANLMVGNQVAGGLASRALTVEAGPEVANQVIAGHQRSLRAEYRQRFEVLAAEVAAAVVDAANYARGEKHVQE